MLLRSPPIIIVSGSVLTRVAASTPGTFNNSGTCSVSYSSLNNASFSGGTSMLAVNTYRVFGCICVPPVFDSGGCAIERFNRCRIELQLRRGRQIFKLRHRAGARNRRRDGGSRHGPRERDARRRGLLLLCRLIERVQDPHAALVQVALDAGAARALGQIGLRAVFAGQETARKRKVT